MGLLQFNVSVGEKTRPIHIQESAGVDELFRKVSADCANNVDPQDIMLVFGGVVLEYNKNKSFKDCSLVHLSALTLLVRLHGGANPGSTSLPTQRATSTKPRRVVRLQEIKTWAEIYDGEKEELKICLEANGKACGQGLENEHTIDPEINNKVSLFEGDITSLQVDGIVSSGNSDLTSFVGVGFVIRTVAGPEFQHMIESQKEIIREGEAMVTSGFNLPAKFVVHTVGPEKEDPALLKSCYRNCLEKMRQQIKSLAFPCISTGFNEYHREKAVLVALKTVRVWLEEQKRTQQLDQVERIIFCLYTPEDVSLYRTWMQVFYPSVARPASRELLPLPGFIETTTTEPDMLDMDESPVRAKMPCGHVIGPLSMTDYCRDLLAKGRYRFYCPSTNPTPCNREWEYFLVRHVARLSPEEMQDIEKQISENYVTRAKGMQMCPGCQVWCFRASVANRYVRCKMCTDANGKSFDFCWWCLNPWRASSANQPCCDGKDGRLSVLETCPTKKINSCKDCPSIRGCPKCGILIEHKDKCGHMDCSNCGDYGFCFICLTEKKNGKWLCVPWKGTCILAPRQTALPGSM